MLIRENVPLAPLTTLGVGGPARYFAEANSEAEVLEATGFAHSRDLPLFVLGGGSNVVVADTGFPGLVLKIAIGGVSHSRQADRVLFTAGAGHDWDALVEQSVRTELRGSGVSQRDSRHRRRNACAERRRLWARGLANDH